MEEQKYVVFQLGEQKYGMSLIFINGIEQDYHIIPVPNAPEGVKGIINLRGEVIPVYSLRVRFGMESRIDNEEKSLLVTTSSGTALAYEVDAVLSIDEIQQGDISDMPSIASNEETEFMEQVLHVGEDIVIAINVNKILSEETRLSLNQIIEDNK
ncbi:MAG: chemotaxis protein CheW [Bacteroidales bacterium]|nr:chemotaxis protein CheW [Clostridium sp.]MCM1204202.1 chemotaxis protein CheW [Bacteroidales bacterium]